MMFCRFTMVILMIFASVTVACADWGSAIRAVDKMVTTPERKEPRKPARPAPPPVDEEQPSGQPSGGSALDDNHYIFPDDYFIAEREFGKNTWIWVKLAKVVTPPTRETKNEGEFMEVVKGHNVWTKYYWQTRIAEKSDLKLGTHVIMFHDNRVGGVYKAPVKKDKARGGSWFYAKITDMSDSYKGYVTVSGNYKAALDNLRVFVAKSDEGGSNEK